MACGCCRHPDRTSHALPQPDNGVVGGEVAWGGEGSPLRGWDGKDAEGEGQAGEEGQKMTYNLRLKDTAEVA